MLYDTALRTFLAIFRLPGEAQMIDRIMEAFSIRYCECNDDVFGSSATAFVLAFSLIMLNTDLHNPNIKNKMTKQQFIKNNSGIDQGRDLPTKFLEDLYMRISVSEIKLFYNKDTNLGSWFTVPKKSGYLLKQGGRRKNWRQRWFTISGSVLLYLRSPNDTEPLGVIPLENLVVTVCDKLTIKRLKRNPEESIFQLFDARTPEDQPIKASKKKGGKMVSSRHSKYYFLAESPAEMREWIKVIRASVSRSAFYHQLDERKELLRESSSSLSNEEIVMTSSSSGAIASSGSTNTHKKNNLHAGTKTPSNNPQRKPSMQVSTMLRKSKPKRV